MTKDSLGESQDTAFSRLPLCNAIEITAVPAALFLRTKTDTAAAERTGVNSVYCILLSIADQTQTSLPYSLSVADTRP